MYQLQQNTLYLNGGRFCENNLLTFLIGSQPILEERSLMCGRRGLHSINLDIEKILCAKSATFVGKGYFASDGAIANYHNFFFITKIMYNLYLRYSYMQYLSHTYFYIEAQYRSVCTPLEKFMALKLILK